MSMRAILAKQTLLLIRDEIALLMAIKPDRHELATTCPGRFF
jgi:hypothetical protein